MNLNWSEITLKKGEIDGHGGCVRADCWEFVKFGPVQLQVVDRDRSLAWWRDVVGLRVLDERDDVIELGVDSEPVGSER